MPPFELNTDISNRRDLQSSDLTPYDALYLGNPYCRDYEANFLERVDELAEAIRQVKGAGRRAYVTTYAAPRNSFLDQIRRVLEVAEREGADAVEAHNLGVLRICRTECPGLPVFVGGFANVYTDVGARVLLDSGARRLTPNYELSLEEIGLLARNTGAEVELLVHGKMPLGISDYCFLLEYEKAWGIPCPSLCQQDLYLRQGDWAMKSVGKGVLSGRDVCMLEHLPALWAAGYRTFRLTALSERPAYRAEVGAVYRAALTGAAAGGGAFPEAWWEVIRRHSRIGLCNGFYFGQSGQAYVPARQEVGA
ncbi:MAG TPA: peptidase U32 family protein [Candidatus Methylomirabilis sp.]|jgi:putative protease|nr:peptidase U32 family protein [Candidatus Methylomirabilis sp.]